MNFFEFNELMQNNIRKTQLINNIYNAVLPILQGIHADQYWTPVHKMFKAFQEMKLDYVLLNSEYFKDEQGLVNRKKWEFAIKFINQNGNPDIIFGHLNANGTGSVADPLEKYDLTLVLSGGTPAQTKEFLTQNS